MKTIALITFHFVPQRVPVLERVVEGLRPIPGLEVFVFCNVGFEAPAGAQVVKCEGYGHPHNLAWEHKRMLRDLHRDGSPFDYYVYLEDDVAFTRGHFDYWLEFRRPLGRLGLLPAFTRYELAPSGRKVALDYRRRIDYRASPRVTAAGVEFVPPPSEHQALYLLDRELLDQHVRLPSCDPTGSSKVMPWGVRERAAFGPAFDDPPAGFRSRYVVPLDGRRQIDPRCHVHHLPNKHVNDPASAYGKIPLDQVVLEGREASSAPAI